MSSVIYCWFPCSPKGTTWFEDRAIELFRIKLHLANWFHLHSLPKSFTSLSKMPQQPDTEVESEQLFPLLRGCIILHNLFAFSLLPTGKKNKPFSPLTFALLSRVYQPAGFPSYQDHGFLRKAWFIVFSVRMRSQGPWGVAGQCAPDGGRVGPCRGRAAGPRPLSQFGPVYSPERCKSVSSSRRLHLFLHLLHDSLTTFPGAEFLTASN